MQRRRLISTLVLVCAFGLVLGAAGTAEAASKIAFRCLGIFDGVSQDEEICIVNSDGSGLQRSNLQISAGAPSWSPNGSQIASWGTDGLWVMDADFGNAHIVISKNAMNLELGGVLNLNELGAPSWSPELPSTVAAISPFGQFVIVFMLGGVTALYFSRQRGQTSGLAGS